MFTWIASRNNLKKENIKLVKLNEEYAEEISSMVADEIENSKAFYELNDKAIKFEELLESVTITSNALYIDNENYVKQIGEIIKDYESQLTYRKFKIGAMSASILILVGLCVAMWVVK